MDRIMTLLFTLLPGAGMAVMAKKPHKKGRDDSDVIVTDTGGRPGRGHKTKAHHKGVGDKRGVVDDMVPLCYQDIAANYRINLVGVPKWTVRFGNLALQFENKKIVIAFPNGAPVQHDDWVADGETFNSIDLTTYDANGDPVAHLSHPIDPKLGFGIYHM